MVTRQITWGGGEALLAELAHALQNMGHNAVVVAPRCSELVARGLAVTVTPWRPDMLIANDFHSLWRTLWLGGRCRRAFICHGWWQVSYLRNVACRLTRTRVFAVSSSVAEALTARGGLGMVRVPVLPVGPDSQRFRRPLDSERRAARLTLGCPSDDELVLAWVGRFQDVKRPELFIEVLRRTGGTGVMVVPERVHSADEAVVRDQVREGTKTAGNITVQEGGDPKAAYWAADFLVSTSRFESLGLAMLEAMACGVPVITTAMGGPDDFVAPSGCVLPPATPASLIADTVRELWHDNWRDRSLQAQASSERRSMSSAAAELIS